MKRSDFWLKLPDELKEALAIVSEVFPFRTNEYVVNNLIDWSKVPDDPMYQLTFVQAGMLSPDSYSSIRDLMMRGATAQDLARVVTSIRMSLNPHPAGQLTHNVPTLDERALPGVQHKYEQTVLFFPAQGQTCHAYCTYCFRWAQFVDLPGLHFEAREAQDLVTYLLRHREVTDVLFTGGDPLIMSAEVLRRYVEPLLRGDLAHVQTIRLGTKALAYWPQRFVTDPDADDLLRLFEEIVTSGRHLTVMAHYSHPVELEPEIARRAVSRVRSSGAEIRIQAPLVRHVNDNPDAWSQLWQKSVHLGMIPYYMFIERDTGPRNYFEVPLIEAHEIFRSAYSRVSGLARTVRGPCMSAFSGKVRLLGVATLHGERCFVLDFLQARDPEWTRIPFFAKFDEKATWFDQLMPLPGAEKFFTASERNLMVVV